MFCRIPLLFHAVKGKDEREANSPSWFNVLEAKVVVQYAEELRILRGQRFIFNCVKAILACQLEPGPQ